MKSFLVFLALVAMTSFFGAFFRPGPWYDELVKPALTPPGWIFSPVWITLYFMIALAGWELWKKVKSAWNPVLIVWAVQLVFNALWSWIFFGLENPALAFANIVVLLVLIVAFITHAHPVSRKASLLFVPYFLWVSFATYLNLGIVVLN